MSIRLALSITPFPLGTILNDQARWEHFSRWDPRHEIQFMEASSPFSYGISRLPKNTVMSSRKKTPLGKMAFARWRLELQPFDTEKKSYMFVDAHFHHDLFNRCTVIVWFGNEPIESHITNALPDALDFFLTAIMMAGRCDTVRVIWMGDTTAISERMKKLSTSLTLMTPNSRLNNTLQKLNASDIDSRAWLNAEEKSIQGFQKQLELFMIDSKKWWA